MSALVMELVEGDDLSQHIARGAIPLDEALPIAKQIAEALEAAHEQGIIHRDLKPANIKVRADGTVKVLVRKLHELAEGDFLTEATNVLAFGLPGVGKSHAMCAIGHALVDRGHAVLFMPTYSLVQELLAAKRNLELPRALRKLDHYAVLLLDDVGYIQQSPDEAEILFSLLAERYERRSVVITSNLIIADHYWDWGEVERHYRRAIPLDPNDATTMRFYAYYLAYTGRPVEALPIAEQACRLDPVSPSARMNLGVTLLTAGRVDAAVHEFEETLDLDSNFSMAHIGLGLAYLRKGMPERAVAEAQKARAESGSHPGIVALYGYTLARAGRRNEALTTLDDLGRLAGTEGPSPFLVALVYVGLEDNVRAFQWLEKALEARDWQMPMLKADVIFDPLRADSRFPRLLARIGLPR